ncbi:MAG TPA: hypothetical protein VIS31_06975 [Woeseiaceae bacterium]
MADRRMLLSQGVRAAFAASLALALMQPALGAPGHSDLDKGTEDLPRLSEIALDVSGLAPPRTTTLTGSDENADRTALSPELVTNTEVAAPEAPAETPPLPSGVMKAQVPGVSNEDLLRYKRHMLRKDI